MGVEQEGSIAFRLRHNDPDWATNDKTYRFNTIETGPVRAWAMKKGDGTVEFHVSGPLKSEIVLEGRMPQLITSDLHVVITWNQKQVQLYLNAVPHGVVLLPPAKPGAPPDA